MMQNVKYRGVPPDGLGLADSAKCFPNFLVVLSGVQIGILMEKSDL
jgi:hypothetical protein